MNALESIRRRIAGEGDSADRADLILGFPLETGDRTVYPVLLDDGPHSDPRRIGHLIVDEDGSTFHSLESDRLATTLIAVATGSLLVLLVVAARVLRGRSEGSQG